MYKLFEQVLMIKRVKLHNLLNLCAHIQLKKFKMFEKSMNLFLYTSSIISQKKNYQNRYCTVKLKMFDDDIICY